VKTNPIKKGKLPQEKPEKNSLEKEIEEMIDREKTKGKIVSKLFNQTVPPAGKYDH
jgi:hypothetical protein